jgi:hypothetical protein
MSASAAHSYHSTGWQNRRRCDAVALAGTLGQVARRHNDNVRPDGLAEHLVSTKDANFVADTFLDCFCNLVDRKPVGIDHGLLRLHPHSHLTPACLFLVGDAFVRRATDDTWSGIGHKAKLRRNPENSCAEMRQLLLANCSAGGTA